MNLKIAAILLSGFLLTACSDPKEARLPADVTKWTDDSSLVDAVKKLDDSEKKLFIGYTTRCALASAGHRREYGDLHIRERCSAEAVAVSGCGSDRRPGAASAHKPNAEDGLQVHNRRPSAELRSVARPLQIL